MTQAYQAESEFLKSKSRQAQGIAVAKANGKIFGRPKKELSEERIKIARQYQNQDITLENALNLLNLKKSAFYHLCNVIKNL